VSKGLPLAGWNASVLEVNRPRAWQALPVGTPVEAPTSRPGPGLVESRSFAGGATVAFDTRLSYRRQMMEAWGAKVIASPSPDTNAGRNRLAEDQV
jgi:hypothetical protein